MNLKRILSITVIIILLVLIRNIGASIYGIIKNENTVQDLQSQLIEEKKEHVFLNQRLSEVQSTAFVEKEAREKLGLVRQNEYPVFLAPPSIADESTGTQTVANWKKWKMVFRL